MPVSRHASLVSAGYDVASRLRRPRRIWRSTVNPEEQMSSKTKKVLDGVSSPLPDVFVRRSGRHRQQVV
jgi:hypothetical protein